MKITKCWDRKKNCDLTIYHQLAGVNNLRFPSSIVFGSLKYSWSDLKMREIVRIQKFGVVTVSRWDATMNGAVRRSVAENDDSLFKFFINSCCCTVYFNFQLFGKITFYFKIQNSACLSMELLPTNFIHYLLEWILNSRIHIMDFSILSLHHYCRPVNSTCVDTVCKL